jgi:type I restriction enzyme S subunit
MSNYKPYPAGSFLMLLGAEFTAFAIMESDRVAMPKLNRETLATTRLPIPPLAEQHAIVAHLDEKCGKIDQLKAMAERGIAAAPSSPPP